MIGCALIGNGISHSFSRGIYENFLNIKNYELINLEKDKISNFLKEKEFKFINVTAPYKKEVLKYIDVVSDVAQETQAVNCIKNIDGVLYGHNTDVEGFSGLLLKNNINLCDKNIVIFGNGATSRTVEFVCRMNGVKSIKKIARDDRAQLKNNLELKKYLQSAQVLINTTPCGMFPNTDDLFMDLNLFKNLEYVIDLIYNPINTKLILEAKKRNIKTANGLYMLVKQAIESKKFFYDNNFANFCVDDIYIEILKTKTNIVLIGMPGSGKTTIAVALSKTLNKNVIDTDVEIEKNTQLSVSDLFNMYGEHVFREKESKIVRNLSLENNMIISTGGGVILDEENIRNLKQNGLIIFLDKNIDNISLSNKNRPLIKNALDLEKTYKDRFDLYKNAADIIIDANQPIDKITKEVSLKFYEAYGN